MSVISRLTTSFAAAAVAVASVAFVGVARADEDQSSMTLTPTQITAVTAARGDYLKAAWQAKVVYRTDVTKARDAMDASLQTPRLNVLLAKDAYEVAVRYGGDATATKAALTSALSAYRTAYEAALGTAKTATDAARTTQRTALDKAKSTYVAAISAAFPGTTPPRSLVNLPGRGMGWFSDHDGWEGLAKEFGISQKFDMNMPMGMGWAWGHD